MSAEPRPTSGPPPDGPEYAAGAMAAEDAADMALREALFALEVPAPSPDFDERVLSAVRGRSLWKQVFGSYLRPALATASASAAVTLLLVHIATKPPRPVSAADVASSAQAQAAGAAQMRRALESDAPTYAALQSLRDAAEPKASPGKPSIEKREKRGQPANSMTDRPGSPRPGQRPKDRP